MLSTRKIRHDLGWIPILIVAFTGVFRLSLLTIKPPHFDEGVNGWFLDEMARTGYYHYDPANYHGPLHFYILFVFQQLLGRNLWAIRLPVALVSTLTVYLVTCFDRFIDRRTCWFAAAAMAVSPGMEFYGRYAIHESEFVFFLVLTVWGFLGISRVGTVRHLWAAMLGITGMILTKETYIIHFAAFALAGACFLIVEKLFPSSIDPRPAPEPYSIRQLCAAGAASTVLILFFYSGTFMDVQGLHGIFHTFSEWAKTGQKGNGHEKTDYDLLSTSVRLAIGKKPLVIPITANYYWFALMFRYEWPVLLGLATSPLYIWPFKNRFIRYLIIYGWGALIAYSIVRYKTPWCVITIVWPFFFSFGDLLTQTCDKIGNRVSLCAATILLAASFAWSLRLNFLHYTDENEPYVYVQTLNDINKLTGPLFKLVAEDPANYHLRGNIILSSYHPLPWVLGDFTNIGWYDETRSPDQSDADFLVVEQNRIEEIEKKLKNNYFTEQFRLRGSMDTSKLYLSFDKFRPLFPDRKPELKQKR